MKFNKGKKLNIAALQERTTNSLVNFALIRFNENLF